MSITNIVREPFLPSTVFGIVFDESQKGHERLKERVTEKVVEIVGVKQLPKKVSAWIHQYCVTITAGTPMKEFDEYMQRPIDLASLPNRKR